MESSASKQQTPSTLLERLRQQRAQSEARLAAVLGQPATSSNDITAKQRIGAVSVPPSSSESQAMVEREISELEQKLQKEKEAAIHEAEQIAAATIAQEKIMAVTQGNLERCPGSHAHPSGVAMPMTSVAPSLPSMTPSTGMATPMTSVTPSPSCPPGGEATSHASGTTSVPIVVPSTGANMPMTSVAPVMASVAPSLPRFASEESTLLAEVQATPVPEIIPQPLMVSQSPAPQGVESLRTALMQPEPPAPAPAPATATASLTLKPIEEMSTAEIEAELVARLGPGAVPSVEPVSGFNAVMHVRPEHGPLLSARGLPPSFVDPMRPIGQLSAAEIEAELMRRVSMIHTSPHTPGFATSHLAPPEYIGAPHIGFGPMGMVPPHPGTPPQAMPFSPRIHHPPTEVNFAAHQAGQEAYAAQQATQEAAAALNSPRPFQEQFTATGIPIGDAEARAAQLTAIENTLAGIRNSVPEECSAPPASVSTAADSTPAGTAVVTEDVPVQSAAPCQSIPNLPQEDCTAQNTAPPPPPPPSTHVMQEIPVMGIPSEHLMYAPGMPSMPIPVVPRGSPLSSRIAEALNEREETQRRLAEHRHMVLTGQVPPELLQRH